RPGLTHRPSCGCLPHGTEGGRRKRPPFFVPGSGAATALPLDGGGLGGGACSRLPERAREAVPPPLFFLTPYRSTPIPAFPHRGGRRRFSGPPRRQLNFDSP